MPTQVARAVRMALDAREYPYGKRVSIHGGMKEFHGKTGTLKGKEEGLHRVKLDAPVQVLGVGDVHSDLWHGSLLKAVREPVRKAKDATPLSAGEHSASANKHSQSARAVRRKGSFNGQTALPAHHKALSNAHLAASKAHDMAAKAIRTSHPDAKRWSDHATALSNKVNKGIF